MSTGYINSQDIPTTVLCKRLDELCKAVVEGPEAMAREFTMRVPAELDRDADTVIAEASRRLREET